MPVKARLEFYGEFLSNLASCQKKAMWQQQRFPFDFVWPAPLKTVVELFKESQATKQT
jgi:hypothetical protein